MDEIIFAIPAFGTELETEILVESIREFGGTYSNSKIWLMIPKVLDNKTDEFKQKMVNLNAEFKIFKTKTDRIKFPFVAFALSAAEAEKEANGQAEFLVWLDHNILVIKEPTNFLLAKNKKIAFRPVHHTLIGSEFNEPLDSFWKLVYKKCNVEEELLFPMKTHVDGKTLRPYINSGFISIRPELGFLEKWAAKYLELLPLFESYYKQDDLYAIFTHQAILSAMLLTSFKKEEMEELPFEYNYPIHLYPESEKEYQPKDIQDMVVLRFYLKKLQDPEWRKDVPIGEPLLSWIQERVD